MLKQVRFIIFVYPGRIAAGCFSRIMDILLVIIAFTLMGVGLAGAVVPVIPGPPLGYVGLLFLQWSRFGNFSTEFLLLWAAITIVVVLADYYLPVWMTRKFGGSRAATIGSALGLLVGLFFFPPLGLVVGPFVGALIGQIITDGQGSAKAFRVAFGSFVAFIVGVGAKLVVVIGMIVYAVKELIA